MTHKWCDIERSSSPVTFYIIHMGNSSFELTWSTPIKPHGRIEYYTVSWIIELLYIDSCFHYQVYYGYRNQPMRTVNVVNFTGTYTLDSLTSYTEYSVYVTAVRSVGYPSRPLEGHKSRTVTGRTLAGGETIYGYMKC